MIDTDTIEKYILGGEWENQYSQVIEELLAEVKRLREWKKLVSDIVQQQDGSHLREMLKEMIE